MIINHKGVNYEIVNWDNFSFKLLNAVGFQLESEIVQQINKERLVDTGEFKRSINHNVRGNSLLITSKVPYGVYLEYGTAGTKKGVIDPYGEFNQPPNPSRKMPLVKKGNKFELVESLSYWADRHGFDPKKYWALAKHIQEYGLEPRAPFRKVMYNVGKMENIIEKAVRIASK